MSNELGRRLVYILEQWPHFVETVSIIIVVIVCEMEAEHNIVEGVPADVVCHSSVETIWLPLPIHLFIGEPAVSTEEHDSLDTENTVLGHIFYFVMLAFFHAIEAALVNYILNEVIRCEESPGLVGSLQVSNSLGSCWVLRRLEIRNL